MKLSTAILSTCLRTWHYKLILLLECSPKRTANRSSFSWSNAAHASTRREHGESSRRGSLPPNASTISTAPVRTIWTVSFSCAKPNWTISILFSSPQSITLPPSWTSQASSRLHGAAALPRDSPRPTTLAATDTGTDEKTLCAQRQELYCLTVTLLKSASLLVIS